MMHAVWFRPALLAALAISLVFRPAARVSGDVEPNDAPQQAETIEPGVCRGSLGQQGDQKDVYTFSVNGGQIIHLVMEPTEGDERVAVRLLNSGGSGLARLSSDGGRDCEYFTAAELGQGAFFAEVSGSGSYTLNLEITTQNDGGREVDAPGDAENALVITPGAYVGVLGDEDKADFYTFRVKGGETISLSLAQLMTGGDMVIWLKDERLSNLGKLREGESNELTYLTASDFAERSFYVTAGGRGFYRIDLAIRPQNDAGSGGDAPADTARAVTLVPGRYEGVLADEDKTDAYAFSVSGGDIVNAAMGETEGDAGVMIVLFDHTMNRITHFQQGHEREFSYMTPAELGDETFYLTAGGSGNYAFEISKSRQDDAGRGGDAPSGTREAFSVGPGLIRGTVQPPDNRDCYRFSMAEGQEVAVEFQADFSRFEREMPAVTAILMDPRDSQVASVKSSGTLAPLAYGPIRGGDGGEWKIAVYGEGDYTVNLRLAGAGGAPLAQAEQPPAAGPRRDLSDSIEFGGGSRFDIAVPGVAGKDVNMHVSWSPPVEGEALLFKPGLRMPVASAVGKGSLSLSAPAGAEDEGDWLLRVNMAEETPDLRGTVDSDWYAEEGSSLQWVNRGAGDEVSRGMLDEKLDRIRRWETGQQPESDADRALWDLAEQNPLLADAYRRMNKAYTIRDEITSAVERTVQGFASAVIDTIEAVQTAADEISGAVTKAADTISGKGAEGGELSAPELPEAPSADQPSIEGPASLAARFLRMECVQTTSWDDKGEADAPYVLFGIVSADSQPEGVRTEVIEGVTPGQKVPAEDVADALMMQRSVSSIAYMVVVLMEHNATDPEQVLERFKAALADARASLAGEGAGGGADPAQLVGASIGLVMNAFDQPGADVMIGVPHVLEFRAPNVREWTMRRTPYGNGLLYPCTFEGNGAKYDISFRLTGE